MRSRFAVLVVVGILVLVLAGSLSACQRRKNVCPLPEGTPQPKPALDDLINLPPPPDSPNSPLELEIGGKLITVDKLVAGPLCNDSWSGTVYVGCDAIVADSDLDADKNPLFLKGCSLKIAPNTVVYVAAHNDAAYYKGCSCHTGEDPIP